MAEVDEEILGDLVRSKALALYEARSSLPAQTVDLVDEERKKSYLKAIQLKNLWKSVYEKFIQQAIWPSGRQEAEHNDRLQSIIELIKIFDGEMIALSGVISDQQATIASLEHLLETIEIVAERDGQLTAKQRRKNRERIRKASKRVMKSFEAMEAKIVTPGLIRRQIVRLWGGATIEIDPEVQQRLGALVGSSLRGTSRTIGFRLGLPEDTIKAFGVLDLVISASKQEMLERYKFLMRQHHPDVEGGSDEMARRLTEARGTLIAFYGGGDTRPTMI